MSDFTYADPATLRGQLQRGRGLGALRARNTQGDAEEVYACVAVDSRWDRQVENRDAYLARLVHRLDLPLGPIEQQLLGYDGDEEQVDLALQVLALLPFVGRLDAVAVLRRYAVEGWYWPRALEAIEWTGVRKLPGIWEGFDAEVVAGHDDAELAARIDGPWEPWTALACTQPRIRRVLDGFPARATPPTARQPLAPDPAVESSSAELYRQAVGADRRERRSALEELGRRGDPVVLDLAEDVSLRNAAGWIPGIVPALRHLGPAAVDRARAWAGTGDGTLEQLAVEVLAASGERGDGRYLLEMLTAAADAGEWCMTEPPARGLGRLHMAGAADALVHVWEATVHSYAREAVLEGLRGCAPDTADRFAVEGLDDCEPNVQRAAVGTAPDTAQVRARLAELRDDPLAPEIREALDRRSGPAPVST